VLEGESDNSAAGLQCRTNGVNGHGIVSSNTNGLKEDHSGSFKLNGIEKANGTALRATLPSSQVSNVPSNKLITRIEDTNGHSMTTTDTWASRQQLLVFSARDEAALQRVHQQLSSYFTNQVSGTPLKLRSLAYSLSKHRTQMTMRSFVVASPHTKALPKLEGSVRSRSETQLCFVFTGQGAQYARMGMDLMQYNVFKTTLDEINNAFHALGADWSLFGEVFRFLTIQCTVLTFYRRDRKPC
jgi:acyl transferase domain-containing protein